MLARHVSLVALLVACSCGDGHRETSAQPSATASASASTGVFVSAEGVFLDGQRLAGPAATDEIVAPLLDALRSRREAWRDRPDADLSQPFPGAVSVELAKDTSCKSALAVLRACSSAGFPNVSLTIGTVRTKLGVSDPSLSDGGSAMPHLWFREDGLVELRKDACFSPYATVTATNIAAPMKKLLPSSKLRTALVGCDPQVAFAEIVGFFDAEPEHLPAGLHAAMQLSFYQPCIADPAVAPRDVAAGDASMSVRVVEDEAAVGEQRIRSAIDALRPKLLGCYGLRGSKPRAGMRLKLLLTLEIGDTGVLTSGYATDAVEPFPFPPVEKCINQEVRALTLDPPPARSATITVELEFRER